MLFVRPPGLDSAVVALVTLLAHHNGEYVCSMYPAAHCDSSRSGSLSHISQCSSHESLPEFIIPEEHETKQNEYHPGQSIRDRTVTCGRIVSRDSTMYLGFGNTQTGM